MAIWQRLKESLGLGGKKGDLYPDGATPSEKDTITAIRDLSRAVMDNPNAVEIYLALGNLYRSRGDVERAVQIRESLLIRPELPGALKGKTYFELGQDYRRAGMLDRAFSAYVEAERLGMPAKLINTELAGIYSSSGNWEKASEYFYAVGNKVAEAHYLVRQGDELLKTSADPTSSGERRKAMRFFNRAVKISPASIEGWAAIISQYAHAGKWGAAAKTLGKALEAIAPEKSFMLFEELVALEPLPPATIGEETARPDPNTRVIFNSALAEAFVPVLLKRPPEFFPNYYGAMLLNRIGRREEAEQCLDKALVMQPDFWFGRLLHLDIARQAQALPPVLDVDLEFFINQSQHLKRYICSVCGLNRDQLFYCCPRCASWHSATFKASLTD